MSLVRLPIFPFLPMLAVTVVASLATGPAAAQTFEGEGATAILEGLGVIEAEKPEIDIKERGPLVIPTSRDLPPPRAPGSSISRADWPVDADEKRKNTASVEKIWKEQERSGKPLKPSEMQGDRLSAAPTTKMTYPESDRARTLLSPAQLSNPHKLMAKQESWAEKGEPNRRVLSDPPTGYRTPSTAAPYVAAPKKGVDGWWDKINPFD